LLGPRSRKPFPQIKIYHYTPGEVLVHVHILVAMYDVFQAMWLCGLMDSTHTTV